MNERLSNLINSMLENNNNSSINYIETVNIYNNNTAVEQTADVSETINQTIPDNNTTTYTETIELEPIVTSFTINSLDNPGSILNSIRQNLRQEGVNINNLLSKTSQTVITTQNFIEFESEKCSICNEKYELNNIIRVINQCNHKFHSNCVDQWFSRHSTCPICRTDLNNNN